MKLQTNNWRKVGKFTYMCKWPTPKEPMGQKRNHRKIRKYLKINENKIGF